MYDGFRPYLLAASSILALSCPSISLAAPSTGLAVGGIPLLDDHISSLPPTSKSDFRNSEKELWLKDLASVFERLYPEFIAVDDVQCLRLSRLKYGNETDHHSTWIAFESTKAVQRVTLRIVDDSQPNAVAVPTDEKGDEHATIHLSSGLIQQLENSSQLSFVLAHEMAHISNSHFAPHLPGLLFTPEQLEHINFIHQRWEFEADEQAFLKMRDAGFSKEQALRLLSSLSDFENQRSEIAQRKHPAIGKRIAALKKLF